jgi:hypothetical protein
LFIICSVRFPEAVAGRLGGTNGLLQIGRKDELSTMSVVHAQLKSEQQIVLSGCPGLELVGLPTTKGALEARIYATTNHIYEVSFYGSRARLASADTRKFFESFQLVPEPAERSGSQP